MEKIGENEVDQTVPHTGLRSMARCSIQQVWICHEQESKIATVNCKYLI
jgi:hypothetical protein